MPKSEPLVLIIDDEEDTLFLYRVQFTRDGFRVATASDGDKGLEQAFTLGPDIILLDLMLPQKSGFDVLHELANDARTKHIPVLALTNLAEEAGFERALAKGAVGYIIKAERNPRQVSMLVRHVLEESRPAGKS